MSRVSVPKYNLCEELINSITHGIGALFGIVALVLTIIFSVKHNNVMGVISSTIYGVSMIVMYTISCLYHALSPRIKAKKVFRVLDHCDIYIFIAGCYTPYCLSLIGGKLGWILFGVIYTSAIIGVLMNAINLEKYKVISTIMYLVMGWMIAFSFNDLKLLLPKTGMNLLIMGGVAYSLGAILYAIGSKKKYFHSIFHFFVLLGTVLQFFSILLFSI